MADVKDIIAARVAKELKDGDVVNLGIGLPTMVVNFLPPDVELIIQSENGIMGMGPAPSKENANTDIVNAGGQPVSIKNGAMFFDSSYSFGIIRGGHVDATILGALEVDEKGNLANWIVPGKMVPGMGGAMDLVVGAKKVIVAMTHTQKGAAKILKKCTLPYTALGVVNLIITEMGVLEVREEGLVLTELHPDFTKEQVQEATEAKVIFSPDLKPMQ
ncbi:MAG: 3-oxoacid CoA-transferase subunit B [Treponema sp.]|nr:3-oxoacid CoA-transferase subunit B [Treponema sp.]